MVDIANAQSTLLTPHDGEALYAANDVSPDGKHVLLTANAGNGYDNAGLLDIATKKIRWLTQDKWEISGGFFSPDGRHLTYTANVDGNTDIYLYDLAPGKARALPLPKGLNEPAGAATAFSRDNSRLLYYHTGAGSPGDLWVYTLADGKSHQLTHSLIGGVRSQDMVEPFLVHYPSKDGKWTISAFVYVPYNLPRNGQHPAIVYVHGGPTAQTMNTFNRFVQYMANQGYLVIAPELSRIDRLRQRISAGQPVRYGRRRFAGRTVGRGLDQANRICRPEKADPHGWQLWRLPDHDGRHQSAGGLGGGNSDRALRELVHRNSERRPRAAAK